MPGNIASNDPLKGKGRWKKGQSGNPGGRKSTKTIQQGIAHLEQDAMASWATAIKNGESWAVTLWLHYWNGKPTERVEMSGADGEPLVIEIRKEAPPNA